MAYASSDYVSPVKRTMPQCGWCCSRHTMLRRSGLTGSWECEDIESCIERTCALVRRIYRIFEGNAA